MIDFMEVSEMIVLALQSKHAFTSCTHPSFAGLRIHEMMQDIVVRSTPIDAIILSNLN